MIWLLATALAAGTPVDGAMHRGKVSVDTVQWESSWRSQARCVQLAAPFVPPEPYSIEERSGQPWLCRPENQSWVLRYERPFPSDDIDLPLVAHQLQRVEVSGARFDSDDAGLTKHLRVWSGRGISRKDRKRLDRTLPETQAATRIYVTPSPGGTLQGALRPPGAAHSVVYGSLAVFVTLGLALVGAYRVLERGARRERFDRWVSESSEDEDATTAG